MEAITLVLLVFGVLLIAELIIYISVIVWQSKKAIRAMDKAIKATNNLLEGPLKKYEKPYDSGWIEKYRRELYRREG